MIPLVEALARAAHLLTYPSPGYGHDLPALVTDVRGSDAQAADALAAFADSLSGLSTEQLQEIFTQTFDLNPVCALEVGWQLFGEEYERGAFLVKMRQLLREYAVEEGTELPDHLATLLGLLPRLDPDEAGAFVAGALLPAVDKMLAAIEKSDSPFRPVMRSVGRLLASCAAARPEVVHA